jgi:carboxymethylenebutenolidase
MQKIDITTSDGVCPSYVFRPEGRDHGPGPWPAAIVLLDGPGIRPALFEIADRLSKSGYVVLLPDLFYRAGAYPPMDPKVVWSNTELRNAHRDKYMSTATPAHAMSDMAAFLEYLEDSPEVRSGPVGVVGYCMGGRLALIAAGTYPDRIGAAASYHGGGLANDQPSSPHLLAPKMKAKIYVASAIEDANFPDDMKARLETALTAAGVDHVVETYPARHGWVPSDMPVHNAAEAEHHWRTLIPFFDDVLKAEAI